MPEGQVAVKLRALLALLLIVGTSVLLGGGASGQACDLLPSVKAAQQGAEPKGEEKKCPDPPKKATISGTVKDGSTGKPVKRAIVEAGGEKKRTDAKGAYRFRLKEGEYTVTPREDPSCAKDNPPAGLACGAFTPRSRKVALKDDVGGVDFKLFKRDLKVEVIPEPSDVVLEELDRGFKPEKILVKVQVTNLTKDEVTASPPERLTTGVQGQDTKPIRQTAGPSPKKLELAPRKRKTVKYTLQVEGPGEFEVEALVLGEAKSGTPPRTLRGLGSADLKADSGLQVKAQFVRRKQVEGSPAEFVDELLDSTADEPFDVNLADNPDQPKTELLPIRLTVRNKQPGAVESIRLDDLAIKWRVEGVDEPELLPLKQASGPDPRVIDKLEPGESAERDFVVEVSGDGTYELVGTAKGKGTGTAKGKTIPGKGRAYLHSRTPLLFFYARVDRTVRSPDAGRLVTAGTAFSVRIRLQNRSFRETLVVDPFYAKLSGNAFDGHIQPAGQPIQVGPDILDLDALKSEGYVVLEPNDGKPGGKDERPLDAVVRTKGSGPTAPDAPATGGTQALVEFDKPKVSLYRPPPKKAGERLGEIEEVTELDKIVFAEGASRHRLSIDDSTPQPPPPELLGAVAHFTYGAGIGLANSVWGGVRGLFYDLPSLVLQGSFAYVQAIVERQSELWQAIRSQPDLLAAYRAAMEKAAEFRLRDLKTLQGIYPGILKAWNQANKETEKKFTGIANQWYHGDWAKAAQDMGEVAGQTVGDIGIADAVLSRALATLPRLVRVVKHTDEAKLAANAAARGAVEAFVRGAPTATRVIAFLAKRIPPGYVFKFDELADLYGITRKQAEYLAKLAKENRILISVRSRAAESLAWIKKGAYLKPEWIKLKNVNHYDVEYLGFFDGDIGRVVIKKDLPSEAEVIEALSRNGVTDDATRNAVLERRQQRVDELESNDAGNVKEIEGWANSGEEIETKFNWKDNGLDPNDAYSNRKTRAKFRLKQHDPPRPGEYVVEVSVDGGAFNSVTGDLDLVAITYANNTALSNFDHARILTILRGPPMFIQHPETATWHKKGLFDFAKKHDELRKDNPVQFGADGRARKVTYDRAKSCFISKVVYTVFWTGGYRHIDRKGPFSGVFGFRAPQGTSSPSRPGSVRYRSAPHLQAAATDPCAGLRAAVPGG